MTAEEHVLDLPKEEIEDRHHELISSRRVEGTRVYDRKGEKLGTIHSVMLNKRTGQAVYAVMSSGGFLGFDKLVHPLPWPMLDYDENKDGYVVELSAERLQNAPVFRVDEADRPRERSQSDLVYDYYGIAFPY